MAKQFDLKNFWIVPEYDGSPNELYQFINVSTMILNEYWNTEDPGCFQNHVLIQGLLNKLQGRAKDVISVYGCSDWNSIKGTLIQNFADQRNENSLTRDLVNLRQDQNETPQRFYEKVMGLLNTISNYIELHTADETIKISKKSFFQQQALTTFLAGLREPMGSTIRAMKPIDLATAMQYIQEENNIRYLQRTFGPPQVPKKPLQTQQKTADHQYAQQSIPQRMYQPMQHFQRPGQQQPHQAMGLQPQFQQPTFRPHWQPNTQQKQMWPSVQPPRFGQNQPNRQNGQEPTPMSISTRNTYGAPTRSMRTQPQARPNFNPAPMFNIEQHDEDFAYEANPYYIEETCSYPNQEPTEEFQVQEDQQEPDVNFPLDPGQNQET
ncbi:uncharacterized protein [Leptinotarsa decemlineata]|uniref:uncharacterized protein n=1 Tax=Leptinotarsa decemlineata TaxID=7539 RepID=UPI003D309036